MEEIMARREADRTRADQLLNSGAALSSVTLPQGLKLAQKLGKQIRGFGELAATLIKLWTSRVATFRAN
jgi:hypothetical protein